MLRAHESHAGAVTGGNSAQWLAAGILAALMAGMPDAATYLWRYVMRPLVGS